MAPAVNYPVPNGAVPPAAGSIYKTVFFINGPNCGWSETYYISPGTNNPSPTTMDKIANAYAFARLSGMTADFALEGYRYSDVAIPGNSTLRVPNGWPLPGQVGVGSTSGLDTPMSNSTGAQLRLSDSLSVVRRNEIYRGIPARWCSNALGTPQSLSNGSAGFKKFANRLLEWVTNVQGGQNAQVGNATLKFVIKDPALITRSPIVSIGTTGIHELIVVNVPTLPVIIGGPALKIGDPVRIGGVRLKCARKTNGIATVTDISQATAPATGFNVTVCKQLCCLGTPLLCPRNAFLYPVLYGYTNILQVLPQVIANRKVGRPFRLPVGRRQACCG